MTAPLPNDMSRIADGLAKPEASNPTYVCDQGSTRAARNLIRRTIVLRKPDADAMAADATAYTAADQVRMRSAGRVLGAYIQPTATLTAHDTNYATVSVEKGDGAGGAGVVMASKTTKITGGTNDWAAGRTEALALSATLANFHFVAGAVIGFSIAKAAAGVVVGVCSICVDIEEEGVDGYAV